MKILGLNNQYKKLNFQEIKISNIHSFSKQQYILAHDVIEKMHKPLSEQEGISAIDYYNKLGYKFSLLNEPNKEEISVIATNNYNDCLLGEESVEEIKIGTYGKDKKFSTSDIKKSLIKDITKKTLDYFTMSLVSLFAIAAFIAILIANKGKNINNGNVIKAMIEKVK